MIRSSKGINNSKFISLYISHQLKNLILTDKEVSKSELSIIQSNIGPSLERMDPILASVKSFSNNFDHLHSLQHSTFLYILSNQIFLQEGPSDICNKIFFLNKALNSIDLHFQVKMPEVFFISHGLGSVIGNAQFGNNFIFFQNITVGRVGNLSPKIGSEVIMYPGSTVTGNSVIGNNVVVSANTVIHNHEIPNNSIVFPGIEAPQIKPLTKNYIELYLSH